MLGDGGIDVIGNLNSIGGLSSRNLSDDGMLISRRKLGRMTKGRSLLVWKELLEDSGDSGLADTQFGGNMTSGMTMGGQGEDVFFLSRGDGSHGGIEEF